MKRFFGHLVAAVLACGLLAMGLLSAPAIAGATGSTHVTSCSNTGGGPNHKVVCLGTINGNDVNVEISNIRILSPGELTLLQANENNLFLSLINVGDIQTQVNNVASGTVIILKNVLNISVCQVKVIEIGLVNTNIAKCS